jgi:hypothetical protein
MGESKSPPCVCEERRHKDGAPSGVEMRKRVGQPPVMAALPEPIPPIPPGRWYASALKRTRSPFVLRRLLRIDLQSVRGNSVVPTGLRSFVALSPALKRRAILRRPSGAWQALRVHFVSGFATGRGQQNDPKAKSKAADRSVRSTQPPAYQHTHPALRITTLLGMTGFGEGRWRSSH